MSRKPKIRILKMEQPKTEVIGEQLYKLLEDWSCSISVNSITLVVHADKGAIWDGASIPRLSWSILGIYPGGRMLAPSLPHDGWCRESIKDKPEWFYVNGAVVVTPYIRDLIFRASCKHVGILKRRTSIMWFCVLIYQRIQCMKQGIRYK